MVPGFFIFMKGVVRERKRGELIELEFKINTISLLEELRAKMTGELKVSLNLEHLTDALIDDFVELINRFPGSVPLTMSLYDTETKIDMPARNARVTVDSDLLNALTAIEGMEFEIVSR
jgi:DNA polymerase-3 subunit alpha